MPSTMPAQVGYLTLTELVFNYALYGGVGYLVAGWPGVWSGLGVFSTVIVVSLIIAMMRSAQVQDPSKRTSAEPSAVADGGRDAVSS